MGKLPECSGYKLCVPLLSPTVKKPVCFWERSAVLVALVTQYLTKAT